MQALPLHPPLLGWPCRPPCQTPDGTVVLVWGPWWWSRREKIFPFQVTDHLFIPQCLLLPLPKTPPKFPMAFHWLFVFSPHISPWILISSTCCIHLGSWGEILEGGTLLCSVTPFWEILMNPNTLDAIEPSILTLTP